MAKKTGKGPKGKQEKKPKTPRALYKLYNTSGEKVERSRKTCPKCGPGMFLAQHGNRTVCGKCTYTEFKSKE